MKQYIQGYTADFHMHHRAYFISQTYCIAITTVGLIVMIVPYDDLFTSFWLFNFVFAVLSFWIIFIVSGMGPDRKTRYNRGQR